MWFLLPLSFSVHITTIFMLFIIGVISSKKVAEEMNESDPSVVVIDEATGMGIALFMLPHSIAMYTMAFILFRIFDIFKPSFIYHVQNIPGGWGIMLDDVLAGMFTLAICHGLYSIL